MRREAGFSMVELAMVSTLLAIVTTIITSCLTAAVGSLRADDRLAMSMESLQRSAMHLSQIMRPCAITTYRVLSTEAHVPLYAAAAGEWIEPPDEAAPLPLREAKAIQFRSATGDLSVNAVSLTEIRGLRKVLDSGELDNGIDDDGDGMIDEGRMVLDYDGISVSMAADIESVKFTLTGRLLTMVLQSAARDGNGRLQRFTATEVLYLRNN